jgi:hypothetical protein
MRFRKRNSDYFGLSYNQLNEEFNKDRDYFKQILTTGLVLSILVWVSGFLISRDPLISQMIVGSVILVTYLAFTTLNGVYSSSKVVGIIIIGITLSIFYWSLLDRIPLLDIILMPASIWIYYKQIVKYDSYSPEKLLKNISS